MLTRASRALVLTLVTALLGLAAVTPAAAQKQTVVIYTAIENEQIAEYKKAYEKSLPNIDVKMLRLSTGDISARFMAEKDNMQADVIWGVGATNMLISRTRACSSPTPRRAWTTSSRSSATRPTRRRGSASTSTCPPSASTPRPARSTTCPSRTSWADLTKPVYKGHVVMPNPASSGTGYLSVVSILQRMGEAEGWKYLDALDKNIAEYTKSGSKPCKDAAAGERAVGVSFEYVAHEMKKKGSPVEMVLPKEGSGYEMEANALTKKGAKNPAAKQFLDWAVSDESLKALRPVLRRGRRGGHPGARGPAQGHQQGRVPERLRLVGEEPRPHPGRVAEALRQVRRAQPKRADGRASRRSRASSADLDAALARLGYAAFRPGQREAIETLLAAGRLLLVAPTGGGKSLSYQLPATLLPGTTLVISPLVALMADQVQALEARGVAATYLASTLDAAEMRRRMARLAAGAFSLVYVAPERLAFPGFRALLRELDVPAGRGRRGPLHQRVGPRLPAGVPRDRRAARGLPGRPRARLHRDGDADRARRDPRPARPARRTRRRSSGASRARTWRCARWRSTGARERERLVDAALAEALGGPGQGRGTAIVYAPTRKRAEEETERLGRAGLAGRPPITPASTAGRARSRQRGFAEGRVEVVVATNAFGMGIDRPDVRAVIHLAPARLDRGLLPGGRPGGPRRGAGPRPAAGRRGRPAAAPGAARARRRGERARPGGGRAQVGDVPRADSLGRGRKLPSRRDPALFRRRGRDARRLRPLRRLPGARGRGRGGVTRSG